MSRQGKFQVGTSGYQYDHWKGVFYPDSIPKKRWFEHYTQVFDTVEINNTFYNLPADWTYLRYHGDQYQGSYSHQYLTAQAQKIQDYLQKGCDVYAYFNNDEGAHAAQNA